MKLTRQNLIRKIYAELRASVPVGESSSDLLRAANEIAAVFLANPEGRQSRATYPNGGTPFEFWSVDSAMADGGWRLLRTESEIVHSIFSDSAPANDFVVDQWLQENA